MVRKAKTLVVQKIERLYEKKGTTELPFGTIARELGLCSNKVVGALASWPGVFEKGRKARYGNGLDSSTHTVWRHIPDRRVTLSEVQGLYGLTLEQLLNLMETDGSLRWRCWQVERGADGMFSRQRVHYVIRKMLLDL